MTHRQPASARSRRKRAPAPRLVDVVSDRLQAARALWRQGRHEEALRQFDLAVRREPNNIRAWVSAAEAYASRYQFSRAERLLEELQARAPSEPGVYHVAGEVYARLKLPAKAVVCFEQAAGLKGVLPRTWIELAQLYERAHRLDDASDLLERALSAEPDLPLALLARARIERRRNQTDQAETTLRSLIETARQDSDLACRAWAEMALLLDQRGEYDQAIEAIARCKRSQLARDRAEWNASEHVLGRFRRMVESITQSDFERWSTAPHDRGECRVALMTGFPRSGTTLLEQVLDTHPDLVSSEERDFLAKEHFTSLHRAGGHDASVQHVLDRAKPDFLHAERKRYLQVMEWLLGESIGSRMHLDKNPAYNLVIPIMLRLFPEARLIVALRDPRDVVLSCYLRYLPLNPVSVRFLSLPRTVDRYTLDLQAWLRFRDLISAPWCEVRYEDAIVDLRRETRRMVAALGLSWNDQLMEYRQRLQTKPINSPTYDAVIRPVYSTSVGRWKNYAKHLEPVMAKLEPFVREFGYT